MSQMKHSSPSSPPWIFRDQLRPDWYRLVAGVIVLLAAAVANAESKGETKVVSHVYNGYARVKLPDGSYRAETYVFGDGGMFDGEPIAGDTIGTIGFDEVARTVAQALSGQNYRPGPHGQAPQLLIMLWYGTTQRTAEKPVAYQLVEDRNARILGFQLDRSRANDLSFTTMAGDFFQEFQAGRYFVVLKAYDFATAIKEKRLKLMWESRFSIQRQAVSFEHELPVMAAFAARTFGQETKGILNPDTIKGTVKMDDIKVLGTEEHKGDLK